MDNRSMLPSRLLLACLFLLCSGCASLSSAQRNRAVEIAETSRSSEITCEAADACALPSPLYDLAGEAIATSTEDQPRHYALILDEGIDSLLARLNLIRSARESIDLQTYIFDKDDSARLVLDELIAAAGRGVRVRILIDQLTAIQDLEILAALSGVHENLAIRIYNPSFGKAKLNYLDYAGSVLCCFRRFNQRMHNKLLIVDKRIGITGGRNYQDDYYDWDAEYNFRDRDVLVAGPAGHDMAASFEAFWEAPMSVPAERLNDVGRTLLADGVPAMPEARFLRPERVEEISRRASDAEEIGTRLAQPALPVGNVTYVADVPQKSNAESESPALDATTELERLVTEAQSEILLQTPYLVMSKEARDLFKQLRQRDPSPSVIVSTNSLAATDNPVVYSMSFKYKRRYLRELGFQIHEYKPFPGNAPKVDLGDTPASATETETTHAGTGLFGSGSAGPHGASGEAPRKQQRTESRPSFLSSGAATAPLPVDRAGPRTGLHSKSMVVDGRIGVIGSHNFDPRSENYNTESAVIIEDEAFAQALAASIRRDMAPENSWTIAPRIKPPVFSGLDYSLGKVSEALPIFDVWPWRYATSYEFNPGPGCPEPLLPSHPDFHACYTPVGDFPEVSIGPKWLYTRILTAFGAGLVPIL